MSNVWLPVLPILANAGSGRVQSPLENVGVLFVIGRLREGVTVSMATEELDRLAAQLERNGAAHRFGNAVVVTRFLGYLMGPVRQALWVLFAAVGVLLVIGCANVSGLMLTRVSLRRREHAIRLALGARRTHLGRQWTLETLILFSGGFQWNVSNCTPSRGSSSCRQPARQPGEGAAAPGQSAGFADQHQLLDAGRP
jgi:hypothetical protein